MPVRVLPTEPNAFMSGAIGYLAPGTAYGVHLHLSLEQLSFVIRGRVRITMGGVDHVIGPGEALTNPPGTTLSFANDGDEPAEVLFVCAPPYPADDSEVVLADLHRPLTPDEREQARRRLGWTLDHFRRIGEDRLRIDS